MILTSGIIASVAALSFVLGRASMLVSRRRRDFEKIGAWEKTLWTAVAAECPRRHPPEAHRFGRWVHRVRVSNGEDLKARRIECNNVRPIDVEDEFVSEAYLAAALASLEDNSLGSIPEVG